MSLTVSIIVFLGIVYLGWSILKIRRLLIEVVALERDNERLNGWLKKYEGRQQKVALTRPEKQMILNALECAEYKGRIQEPITKRFIRNIYNTLREKIKGSIPEYGG